MDMLIAYLNKLPRPEQEALAARCGTTVGYLRKARSAGQRLGDTICAAVERETCGALRCEDLSEANWVRASDPAWPWHPDGKPLIDPAHSSESATESTSEGPATEGEPHALGA